MTFLQSLQDTLDFPFLFFSFFSRSIERVTLIQFDSRYLSKRVPTSLLLLSRERPILMFGWFCFGTINLLGFFFYQGLEWAWELGSPCTFWFIVVIM